MAIQIAAEPTSAAQSGESVKDLRVSDLQVYPEVRRDQRLVRLLNFGQL